MAKDVPQREPNIILLGHGVTDTLQLTVEAQRVLARVGKVYAVYLPPNLKQYLKSLRVECVDLSDRFARGRAFSDAYLDVADFILRRTAEERPVVLLSQGNPLFLNSLNRFLVMQARQRKLSVKVYPGVSQLEALICDLGLDIGTFGLQLFDATRLVSRKHQINPRVPLLMLQLAGFAAVKVGSEERDPKDYQPLIGYLAQFYPAEQPVTLMAAANGSTAAAHATVPLSRFPELVPNIQNTSSLFIDAVRQRQPARPQERPET